MSEKLANAPRRKWIEPVVALLMALTTLCTAWCSYQSAAWTRVSNRLMNEYNALERRAALIDVQGNQALIVHTSMFMQLIAAQHAGNEKLASFYAERFPPDVKKAYEAWLAQKPFENPAADPHPFVPNLYKVRGGEEAATARAGSSKRGRRAIAPANFSPTLFSLRPYSSLPGRRGNLNSHACGIPPRSSLWPCLFLPPFECFSCPRPETSQTPTKTHPMSANLEQHDDRLCVLRVGGELKKSELDAVQSEFVEKIAGAGTIKLLVLLENFTGWERTEAWGDTDFFFSHRNDFEKIAVVGDPRWEAQVLAFTGAGLRKGPVKFFPETGETEARAWLVA